MKRVLQPNLRRGRLADRLGMILLFGLLAVLAFAVMTGVRSLPIS
jgi:hypothetical protein